jgi:hypothetical protein
MITGSAFRMCMWVVIVVTMAAIDVDHGTEDRPRSRIDIYRGRRDVHRSGSNIHRGRSHEDWSRRDNRWIGVRIRIHNLLLTTNESEQQTDGQQ